MGYARTPALAVWALPSIHGNLSVSMPVSPEICGRCGEILPPGNRSCPRCISPEERETTPGSATIESKGNILEDVFDMAFGIDEPPKAPPTPNPPSATNPKAPPKGTTATVASAPPLAPAPKDSVAAPPLLKTTAPEKTPSPENPTPVANPEPGLALPLPKSWTTINVPILVVASQGILLGLVGVMAFGLGTWFGRAWEREARGGPAASTTLSSVKGKCVYRKASGGDWVPDEGAVVLYVPVRAHVVQPAPLMGLRPGDDANLSRRGLSQLKEWGGARGVCQPDGTYEVSLNRDHDYWIIALSAHKRRAATSPVSVADVRRTERYFSLVGDGFGPWEVKTAQKRVTGNDSFDFAF
jgi:hypothetical protein